MAPTKPAHNAPITRRDATRYRAEVDAIYAVAEARYVAAERAAWRKYADCPYDKAAARYVWAEHLAAATLYRWLATRLKRIAERTHL